MIAAATIAVIMGSYLWLGILGTGSEPAFLWPGILGLGVAGIVGMFAPRGSRRSYASGICLGSALAFGAFVVGRAAVGEVPYFGRLDILIALPVFVLYGLFATVITRPRQRVWFVAILLLLVAGNVVVAFYQRVNDPGFSVIPGMSRAISAHNPGGFYNIHPHLAGFLEVAVQFAFALCIFGRLRAGTRVLFGFAGLLGCAGLLIAMSRGGFVSAAAGFLVLVVGGVYMASRLHAHLMRKVIWLGGGVAALSVLVFGILAFGAIKERFGGNLADEEGKLASSGRTAYWSAALEQFTGNAVLGEGPRSFSYHFNKNFPEGFWVGTLTPRHVHNDYLQTLAEYGLLGGALAGFFLFVHIGRGLRYLAWFRNRRFARDGTRFSNSLALTLGALAAAATYLVHSFFDFNMHLLANAALMAFTFGILATPGFRVRKGQDAQAAGIPGFLFSRLAVPLAAVAILGLGWRHAKADEALRRGEWALLGGDEALAISELHQVMNSDPQNFRAIKNLALIRFNKIYDEDLPEFMQVSYAREALGGFESVLAQHPYDYLSMVYAGRCNSFLAVYEADPIARNERLREAERAFRGASYWAPKRFEPATWKADLLRTRAHIAELEGDLARALELARDSRETFAYAVSRTPMRMRGGTPQQRGLFEMRKTVARLARAAG